MSNNDNDFPKMTSLQYLIHFQEIAKHLDNTIEGIMHGVFNDDGMNEKSRDMFFDCLKALMDQVRYLQKVIYMDYQENYKDKDKDKKE